MSEKYENSAEREYSALSDALRTQSCLNTQEEKIMLLTACNNFFHEIFSHKNAMLICVRIVHMNKLFTKKECN